MTSERDANGRERDELMREVASRHAAALAGAGGFVPTPIDEPLPDIDIDFRTDELKLDAVHKKEDGRVVPVLRILRTARSCEGCLSIDDYVRDFQQLRIFKRKVPVGAIYRIQARHPGEPWVDIFWGRREE